MDPRYLKKFFKSLPELSRDSGRSVVRLALSYGICYVFHGANSEEFRALRLYDYNNRRRRDFLLMRDTVRWSDALSAGATKEDLARVADKHLFNETFRDLIRRDWLYVPDSTPEQLRAFLERNEVFLAKACVSTQGKGIVKYRRGDYDPEAFLAEYRDRPYLLEGFIRQHPAMAEANPSTVNTLRVQTARRGDQVILLGGCMRCGGADAFVDNFHQGGVAYPVDMDTGVVFGPGQTLQGGWYVRHPSTGKIMPGFQIPYWEEVVRSLRRAAVLVPHVGFIGWDIAITEEGPELVEGNINYPDPIVVQLGGRGVRSRLKAFVEGT